MENKIIENKSIFFQGQHNRYEIKKLTKSKIKNVPNKLSQNDLLSDMHFDISFQLQFINNFCLDNDHSLNKICIQQLQHKINGYKHQDAKKPNYELYLKDMIDFESTITKLRECQLVCHYCLQNVLLLYKNQREPKQWTFDRIDNDIGHINSNVRIVCLQCNLKRKRQNDKNFLFTSQLKIQKLE